MNSHEWHAPPGSDSLDRGSPVPPQTMTPDRITVIPPQAVPPLAVGMRDAARLLGVSERHLWTLARNGEIPSVLVGQRWVFRIATLDAWLVARELGGTPKDVDPPK